MTFKDLKLQLSKLSCPYSFTNELDLLKNKPFWIWDTEDHKQEDIRTNGLCCFNHIVGLPIKDGKEFPLFDYQKTIYDSLLIQEFNNPLNHNFKDKHLWIKKATGLGVTEFMLRFMAWLCLYDNSCHNSQMCIVTGPNIDIAIKLIKRLKGLFESKLGLTFSNRETVLELNGCVIEAFPSNHLDSYRALDNPRFILLDEADMFRKSDQEDVRHVSERYIGKSDPYIVMVSTPNAPGGLFERIENEPEETCIYKRLQLDYTVGLDKIYTGGEIAKAKQSPSFEREYNLQYGFGLGNVILPEHIDAALRQKYDLEPQYNDIISMGIDPAFGSSKFAVCIIALDGNTRLLKVFYAKEFDRPDFSEMIDLCLRLKQRYKPVKIFIDAANPEFIRDFKLRIGENRNYEKVIEYCKSLKINPETRMNIIPVAFAKEGVGMLTFLIHVFSEKLIHIDRTFDRLISQLRIAKAEDGKLQKDEVATMDLFDALRLALKNYQYVSS